MHDSSDAAWFELVDEECGAGAWLSWQWAVCNRQQTELAEKLRINAGTVSNMIAEFTKAWSSKKPLGYRYDVDRKKVIIMALSRYIKAGGILIEPPPRDNRLIAGYSQARNEHAFLLKCEGLTYKAIAIRLGCSKNVARAMCFKFMWRMRKAMPRTKFYLVRENQCQGNQELRR